MTQEKDQLLKDEYLHIQNIIEAFDGRVLTIKAWSITFSMTAIGVAYVGQLWVVLVVSALSSLTFWLLEGIWKTFQYAHYDRSGKIEKYFAGENPNIVPMQIGKSWSLNWRKGGLPRLIRIMFWYHVMLPHLIVFFMACTLATLHFLSVIKV